MVEIRRILSPVDFSDNSRYALAHAIAVAKWYESRITVLHVIYPSLVLAPPIPLDDSSQTLLPTEADRQLLHAQLQTWLEPARSAGLATEILFYEGGNPGLQILERATSLQADLIVMGTHGRGGFERFVVGSVAERVLRKSTCPVMTVPPPAATVQSLPYKRLLCPVDFSESSLAALRFAFSIAKESDAHLTILHVFDWPPDEELLVERFDSPELRRVVEEQARTRLDALLTDEVRAWCEPETKVSYGKPYRRILEIAEREQPDLIVMGVRGRNPIDVALFGSTTNHVVRRAACPVLTLRQ